MKLQLLERANQQVQESAPIVPSSQFIQQESLPQQMEETDSGIESDLLDTLGRLATRGGASLLEQTYSLPRNIVELGQAVANIPLSKLTGTESPLGESFPYFPSAENIREYVTKPLVTTFSGSESEAERLLSPQTPIEEFSDEVVNTAIPFLLSPGRSVPQLLKKAFTTSAVGNTAKWAAKEIGLPEWAQEGIKMGTMVGVTLKGQPSATKQAQSLYETSKEMAPDIKANVPRSFVKNYTNKLDTAKGLGTDVPSKEFLKQFSDTIKSKINLGTLEKTPQIAVREVMDLSKDLNELFKTGAIPRNAKSPAYDLMDTLIKEVGENIPKAGKEQFKAFTDAKDIWRAVNEQKSWDKFIQKTPSLNKYTKGGVLGGIIVKGMTNPGGLLSAMTSTAVPALGGAATLRGGLNAYDFINNMYKYPGFRSAMGNIYKGFLTEDASSIIKNADKIAKIMNQKSEQPQQASTQKQTVQHKKTGNRLHLIERAR